MTNDINQETDDKPRRLSLGCYWGIMWISVGLAMIIWPDALLEQSKHQCFPDPASDPGIGCFIFNSWGTPVGIVISFILSAITLISAVREPWVK